MIEFFFSARSAPQVISNLGFEVKLTEDGGGPENWDDRCDDGRILLSFLLWYVISKQECLSIFAVHIPSHNRWVSGLVAEVHRKPVSAAANLEEFRFFFFPGVSNCLNSFYGFQYHFRSNSANICGRKIHLTWNSRFWQREMGVKEFFSQPDKLPD